MEEQEVHGLYGTSKRLVPVECDAVWCQMASDQVIGADMAPQVFAYQDDIIMIGRTREEHTANLTEVFRRLKVANLRINADKFHFLREELLYLGHRIKGQKLHGSWKAKYEKSTSVQLDGVVVSAFRPRLHWSCKAIKRSPTKWDK